MFLHLNTYTVIIVRQYATSTRESDFIMQISAYMEYNLGHIRKKTQ